MPEDYPTRAQCGSAPWLFLSLWNGTALLPAEPRGLLSTEQGIAVLLYPHFLQHHVATVTDALGRSTQRGWVQDIPGQLCAVHHKSMGLSDTAQGTERETGLRTSSTPPPQSQSMANKPRSTSLCVPTAFIPYLLYGLKGEGEPALDGPGGAQHVQDIQEVSMLQREGWALGNQAAPGRGNTAPRAGTHLLQGHPAIGVLRGGRWHRAGWQGLKLNSKLSAAPQGKQETSPSLPAPCPAVPWHRQWCPVLSPSCQAQHLADDCADGKQLLSGVSCL